MAHEIEGGKFIEATHGGRVNAWHGLGEKISGEALDLSQVLATVGFTAEFRPVYVQGAAGPVELDFTRAVVRVEDGKVLSTVGMDYEIAQHVPLLEDLDSALGGARFETAGVLRGGREVFALVQAASFTIAGTDLNRAFFLLSTSYDGTSATVGKAVTERVVCANTLAVALGEKGNRFDYRIRHTSKSAARVAEMIEAVTSAQEAAERFAYKAEALAQAENTEDLTGKVFASALAAAYGKIEGNPKTLARRESSYKSGAEMLLECLSHDSNRDLGRWGLLNAVTEWTDHTLAYDLRKSTGGTTEEKRFDSVLEGRADAVKQAIFTVLMESIDGKEIEVPVYGPEVRKISGADLLDSILTDGRIVS